jgi:hypothetical protein
MDHVIFSAILPQIFRDKLHHDCPDTTSTSREGQLKVQNSAEESVQFSDEDYRPGRLIFAIDS